LLINPERRRIHQRRINAIMRGGIPHKLKYSEISQKSYYKQKTSSGDLFNKNVLVIHAKGILGKGGRHPPQKASSKKLFCRKNVRDVS